MLWQEGFFICPPSEIFYFSTDILAEYGCGFLTPPDLAAAFAAGVLE